MIQCHIFTKMPQLIPFYFTHQVTVIFTIVLVTIYIFSKYILPFNLSTLTSRIYLTTKWNSLVPSKPSEFTNSALKSELVSWENVINSGSPLSQFEIKDFLSLITIGLGIRATNLGLVTSFSAVSVIMINFINNNGRKLITTLSSVLLESVYVSVHGIVTSQIDEKKGQMFFPFLFTIFIIILTNNLVGMIPYSLASTSQFIITFSLSFTIVVGATILGMIKYVFSFFSIFVPGGCPLGLLYLLTLIEFISYLARPVSLGLRLAANVLSGHMLLLILSGFAYNMLEKGYAFSVASVLPLAFIICFTALEIGIAIIQAQVFTVLSSTYIKDGLKLH